MLVIGSRAVAHWFPHARTPNDWDMLARRADIFDWIDRMGDQIVSLIPSRPGKYKAKLASMMQVEIEEIDGCASAEFLDALPGLDVIDSPMGPSRVVPSAYLAGIKRTHAQWAIHWEKTIQDLHWLRGAIGRDERQDPDVVAFMQIRHAEHVARLGKSSANLAMSNADFFEKSAVSVQRLHPHDWIHEVVAYGPRPQFEAFKRDLDKASLARDLFEAAPILNRLRCLREEAMVIALERIVIPRLPAVVDARSAYRWALQRLCTTLTSGWFRDFAIDHWAQVCEPDRDFVRLYHDAVASTVHRPLAA